MALPRSTHKHKTETEKVVQNMRSADLGIHGCIKGKRPFAGGCGLLVGGVLDVQLLRAACTKSRSRGSRRHQVLADDAVTHVTRPMLGYRRGHAIRPDTCIAFVFSVTLHGYDVVAVVSAILLKANSYTATAAFSETLQMFLKRFSLLQHPLENRNTRAKEYTCEVSNIKFY